MTPSPGPPYQWDENKSRSNLQTRGFAFDLIHQFDWNTTVTRQDSRSVEEARWVSTGLIEGRLYVAVWTRREGFTRIISLRKANRRKALTYAQARN